MNIISGAESILNVGEGVLTLKIPPVSAPLNIMYTAHTWSCCDIYFVTRFASVTETHLHYQNN